MSVKKEAYSRAQILQFLGAFTALSIVLIVTTLNNAQTPPPPLGSPINLWLTIAGVGVLLPILLLVDTKIRRIRVELFSVMHLLASCIVLFFIGPYDPLVSLWLVLCIVTYIEFGQYSFILSSASMLFTTVLFCILVQPFAGESFKIGEYLFYSLAFGTGLILTAYVITKIIDNSDMRRRELVVARGEEVAQLNKVNTLLNSMSEAILTLDVEGRVTSENAAALDFFNTNASLVGRRIPEVFTVFNEDGDAINVMDMIDGITRSEIRDDIVLKSEDQDDVHLSVQMSPINAGNEKQGIVMTLRDITKQKTLEDEKDEFISVTSHELRTPITVAEASISNLLLMQQRGSDPEKLKTAAETAHEEIVYLAGVVNDLSTLSRAERGVADAAEPVDVDEMLHSLYRRYEQDAAKRGLAFNIDIRGKLPIVEVSRLYIEEMLQNFITNALKYTKEGSVTLAAEEVATGVRCSVSDTGIGISKSDQHHLGERFFRSEDYRTRETNGTGLGLYVVQKLAQKIGTEIEIDSRLDHGSTFSIVVPIKSATQATGKRSQFPLPES